MNIKQKLTSAVAIAGMVAALVAPSAFATTNVTVSGNGAGSYNKVKVNNVSRNIVLQGNLTVAGTHVNAGSSTGGNSSSLNTGGSNTITTGAARTGVNVTVGGSSNTNTAPSCGCADPNTNVTVSGNGAGSYNKVVVSNSNTSGVIQLNGTFAFTSVNAGSSTGGNSSSLNTGGSNTITTGAATTGVNVTVGGSTNTN